MFVRRPLFQATVRQLRHRLQYAGNGDVRSHRDLASIECELFGAESLAGVLAVAQARLRGAKGRRARPLAHIGIEIIVSTPIGAFLGRFEEDLFLGCLLITLRAKAGVVGRHRHHDGRTDFHLVVVNESECGGALALGLTNPKSGRKNRNLRRVMRAAADLGHDRVNEYRLVVGLDPITTMTELIATRINRNKKMRQERAEQLAEMDSAHDVCPTEDGFHPDDYQVPSSSRPPWELMTANLHRFADNRGEIDGRWFVLVGGHAVVRPNIQTMLDRDHSEEANEFRLTWKLFGELKSAREAEQSREVEI